MKLLPSLSSRCHSISTVVLLASGISLLATGCGFGTMVPVVSTANSATAAAFTGKLFGGPVPVVGATVKLYATGCNSAKTTGAACTADGYGVGQFLQEATTAVGMSAGQDTNSSGVFSFAGGYACPAKQFAYVVASGGNGGGGGTNSAIALVAAVGRCEDLSSSTEIYINELSTVAAAYALGHFATTYGSGSSMVVGIGAPVTNNSQVYTDANSHSAGCVSNSFYGTTACPTTSAAGLYHGFLNAANLMPVLYYASSAPSGIVTPGTTVTPPVVPYKLLNWIASAISACVSSSGPTSSACTIVLGAGALNGTTPGNVFQAMMNIAVNPTLTGTAYTPATFLAAAPSTAAYQPILGTAPTTDLSIAINYPKGLGLNAAAPFQGISYVFSNGLDINDNEYIANNSANGNGVANVVSFASNGSLIGFTPNEAASGSFALSPDGIGNLYTGNYGATGDGIQKWSYSTGGVVGNTAIAAVTTLNNVWGMAVDRANNVWLGTSNTGINATGNVLELAAGATAYVTAVNVNQAPANQTTSGVYGVAIDPDQNIWLADYSTTAGAVSVLQNTGTAIAPTYSFETGTGTTLVPAAVVTTTGTSVSGGLGPFGLAFVTNTNSATRAASPFIEWTSFYGAGASGLGTTNIGFVPVTPTLSGAEVTAVSAGTLIATNNMASYLQFAASDGDGNMYGANKNGANIMVIDNAGSATPASPTYLAPCYAASTTNTTCSTTLNGLRELNIDSSGAIWVAMGTVGSVLEIIGTAAPAWPLLSLSVLGRP